MGSVTLFIILHKKRDSGRNCSVLVPLWSLICKEVCRELDLAILY